MASLVPVTGGTAVVITAVGLLLASGVPASRYPYVLAAPLAGILAIGLFYTGGWLRTAPLASDQRWTVASYGLVVGVAVAAVAVAGLTLVPPPLAGPWPIAYLVVTLGATGMLVGVVVGFGAVSDWFEREHAAVIDQVETIHSVLRHNIRNRVMIMSGNLELLSDADGPDARVHEERIEAQLDAIIDLLEETQFALEAIVRRQPPEPTDLTALVRTEIQRLVDTYSDVTVTFIGADERRVMADELLAPVVENVLSNAVVHHDAEATHVLVTFRSVNGVVELRIADDGPGIPEDQRAEVFEPGVGTGTGLGLALARSIVTRYGGEVRIEDNEPRGTVVVLGLKPA